MGKFGLNCSKICTCSDTEQCDVQTGECIKCKPESSKGQCNQHTGISIYFSLPKVRHMYLGVCYKYREKGSYRVKLCGSNW